MASLLVVIGGPLLCATAIHFLNSYEDSHLSVEAALQSLKADTNEMAALGGWVVVSHPTPATLESVFQGDQNAVAQDFARLTENGLDGGDLSGLRERADTYIGLLHRPLTMLAAGALDLRSVPPAQVQQVTGSRTAFFAALDSALTRTRSQSATSGFWLDGAMWATVLGCSGVLIIVLWRGERRRRATAVTLARSAAATENALAFRALVQNSSDVVMLIDAEGRITYTSPAGEVLTGASAAELAGRLLAELAHPDDRESLLAHLDAARRTAQSSFQLECRIADGQGRWRTVHMVITNAVDEPRIGALILNGRDVTERHQLIGTIAHQSHHDSLTGLANRKVFGERIDQALQQRTGAQPRVGVLVADVDAFTDINALIGHARADRLLVAVGERLQACVRPGDTVARVGGDEFGVLVEGLDRYAVRQLCTRIRTAFAAPFVVDDGEDIVASLSIGAVTTAPGGDDTAVAMLSDADLAMQAAKEGGAGRYEFFHSSMAHQVIERNGIEAALKTALSEEQFLLAYQPVASVQDGRIEGVEALCRWRRPGIGLVQPDDFIHVAESTGLIVPMGQWVLGAACRQLAVWRSAEVVDDAFHVTVNVSARQLNEADFADSVMDALDRTGLRPHNLVIEITESLLIDGLDQRLQQLQRLRQSGVRIAVDDFGTGYSSLGYLHRLPVDILKIDRSFVEHLGTDDPRANVVRTVIALADSFGLHVIAEGLETPHQYQELVRLGCGSAQGYMVSPPLFAARMARFLQNGSAAWRTATTLPRVKPTVCALGALTGHRRRPSLVNTAGPAESAFPMTRRPR